MVFNPKVYREYKNGVRRLEYWLKRFPKEAQAASAMGQYAGAQEIMEKARDDAPIGPDPDPRGRPMHPGALKAGAYANEPVITAQGANVEMGFAGVPEPYAVRQHENASYRHPQGGKAFFFRDAVTELRGRVSAIVGSFVNRYIKTGRIASVDKKVPTKAEVPK